MSGIVIPDPRGGLVWIHGGDSEGNPVLVFVDPEGHLQVDVLSSALPQGAASEPTLSGILEELLAHMLPDGAATETTLACLSADTAALLAELALKANLTETQPVSAAGLPLPTGAATENTLGALLTELQLKANTEEAQKVAADSLPLPTGAATQTTLAAILAAQVNRATTPVIYNVAMTLAATEYSQALPANAKKFLIKCRTSYDVKLCFASGASGTTYLTVLAGFSYWEDLIQPATLTLYFQCATAAQVVEIVVWS